MLRREIQAKEIILEERENDIKVREEKCKHKENRINRMYIERERTLLEKEKDMQARLKEMNTLLDKIGGLSRLTITDRDWHKKNKTSATTLFGFTDWKETVCYVHALFGLYPPTEHQNPMIILPNLNGAWPLRSE